MEVLVLIIYKIKEYMAKIILTESQFKRLVLEMKTDMERINQEAEKADKNPTERQKSAGNYAMGHITIRGFKISIENAKGSKRYWTDDKGNKGFNLMKNHYGYFSNTEGYDGDHIDVFIGEYLDFDKVFVVDQKKKDGSFDESKVMLGFKTKEEAKKAYLSNFTSDWKGFMAISEIGVDKFKKWLYDDLKQRKPFSEYVEIKRLNEAKDFFKEHGIEEKACGVGFSEKEQKWYGWSHRAIYGFGIGSKCKKGDAHYKGKEWTAKTLEDAKKMAEDFAESVS